MAGQFIYSKWRKVINESEAAFLFTSGLLSDSSAVRAYAANLENHAVEEGDEAEIAATASQLKPTLVHGRAIYYRQMLVYIQTIVEVMLEEFVVSVFEQHPERMHDFLVGGWQQSKGVINLKQVIDAATRENLISNLAVMASRELMGGKFETALSHVQRVAPLKFDNRLVANLISLAKQRNRIVHENPDLQLSLGQVLDCFELAMNLLVTLHPPALAEQ